MLDPSFAEAERIVSRAVLHGHMIILVGKCEVSYAGRAGSELGEGERLVVIKPDGSFMVHQNRKLTPVNYQPPGSAIVVKSMPECLEVSAKKRKTGELLTARFSELSLAESFGLSDEEEIHVSGLEKHIASALADNIELVEKGLTLIKQERGSRRGPMDLLARDREGNIVVIEIKRRTASLDAVSQLKRYMKEMRKQSKGQKEGEKIRGIMCAPAVTENAKRFLDSEGLEFRKIDLDSDKLKGIRKKQSGLHAFLKSS